jgi:hypothetical protein
MVTNLAGYPGALGLARLGHEAVRQPCDQKMGATSYTRGGTALRSFLPSCPSSFPVHLTHFFPIHLPFGTNSYIHSSLYNTFLTCYFTYDRKMFRNITLPRSNGFGQALHGTTSPFSRNKPNFPIATTQAKTMTRKAFTKLKKNNLREIAIGQAVKEGQQDAAIHTTNLRLERLEAVVLKVSKHG